MLTTFLIFNKAIKNAWHASQNSEYNFFWIFNHDANKIRFKNERNVDNMQYLHRSKFHSLPHHHGLSTYKIILAVPEIIYM